MITNVNMTRRMGNFEVTQRTSDGFFNATELLRQWNTISDMQKQMVHYTDNEATGEFIKILLKEENLKERDSVLLQKRGKQGGTFMHPLLFIDFAMWLNPSFKYYVLKFVSDEMIKYRHDAGDNYKLLSTAIDTLVPRQFMPTAMSKIAEALNWIVFNRHEKNIRNQFGTPEKQKELSELETRIINLINDGFVTEYNQLIAYLKKLYQQKNYQKVFKLD